MGKCKIMVLKKTANVEIQKEYAIDKILARPDPTCQVLQEGQEFIYENGGPMPEGFCLWAWADLQRDIEGICAGAHWDWIRQKNVAISSCTDGLKPVIFKIEKID